MNKTEACELAHSSNLFRYNSKDDTDRLLKYIYAWVRYYAREGRYSMSIEIPYVCDREAIIEDILGNGYKIHPVSSCKYISLDWS